MLQSDKNHLLFSELLLRSAVQFSTSLIIQSVTVQFVRALGNGASAWKTVAIIYAVIGLIVNTISVFSIKELPEEELAKDKDQEEN